MPALNIRAKQNWIDSLDVLVAATGDVSRADLLDRLVEQEAARLGREMPRRLDPSVYNVYAKQKCG
jgi:pyruvate dehydrogenase complex dehydrogenase (E1) component